MGDVGVAVTFVSRRDELIARLGSSTRASTRGAARGAAVPPHDVYVKISTLTLSAALVCLPARSLPLSRAKAYPRTFEKL